MVGDSSETAAEVYLKHLLSHVYFKLIAFSFFVILFVALFYSSLGLDNLKVCFYFV